MKLWDKGKDNHSKVDSFTSGKDKELDLYIAQADIVGTLAHIQMLFTIGLLTNDEYSILRKTLLKIYHSIDQNFVIQEGIEDIHSQIEFMLTNELGEIGKKIHSGRSRNDQVLVDLKLFFREKIREIVLKAKSLFDIFIELSEKYQHELMPGYTHMQIAMPSSFGLWFGAYAESIADDMILFHAAYTLTNQNPLGSAAGYGSSFPLNRTLTTKLLGFQDLSYNVINAQFGRGKTEKIIAFAIANLASTLAKFSMDVCLYMSQNFNFISFPDEFTTGSSIMPHKKNPDVFELIRAKCNKLQALPNDITIIITNLPTGYHRDMQILKELIFPAFENIIECIEMLQLTLEHIQVNTNILDDPKYKYLFSVEEVNKLVYQGLPFREAYKIVGKRIEEGQFWAEKTVKHTHEGSIGNLCNDKIKEKMISIIKAFPFESVDNAIKDLINN